MQLRQSIVAVIWAAFAAAAGVNAACQQQTVSEVAYPSVCSERVVTLYAFAHVSRHGIWISDGPGTSGQGILISLKEAGLVHPGIKRLVEYSRDYRKRTDYLFKARFRGLLMCSPPDDARRLLVTSVDEIQLTEIRDAGSAEG